jgi:hypothetical protein
MRVVRILGLGYAIALLAATLSPSLTFAADAGGSAITKESRAKGMADVPALLTASGSECQLADARFIGAGTDPKTKEKSSIYEAACTGGEGLILDVTGAAGSPPQVFTCLAANGPGPDGKKSTVQCLLPGNADPKAGLQPYVAKAGLACTVDKARALGQSPTNTFFEVACKEGGGGYILQASAPIRTDKPVSANPCIMFDPASNVKCELTDRAAQLSVVDGLVAASGKACAIKDRGFIGQTASGSTYYEVSCQGGKGYVLEQGPNGRFTQAIDCASADAIGGGCKLTDTRQAKTEQAGLYSGLAKKAGYDCTVSSYAPLPVNLPGREAVELACSNRPDGAIGIFPATASGSAEIYDCARSELKGYRCSLTKPAAAYPKLTADLNTLGKKSCTVSNARNVGITPDQHGYIEVGCSDGLPGFFIDYQLTPLTPVRAILCGEAKGISGGCTLPGNTK